jgi:hypothetical protein
LARRWHQVSTLLCHLHIPAFHLETQQTPKTGPGSATAAAAAAAPAAGKTTASPRGSSASGTI